MPLKLGALLSWRLLGVAALAAACGTTSTSGPQPAVRLVFVDQPDSVPAGNPIRPLRVSVQDAHGNPVAEPARVVTVSLVPGTGPGVLGGSPTATAIAGTATFTALTVSVPGSHYRLTATSPGLTASETNPFVAALHFTSLRSGGNDSCGIASGALYCWGEHGALLSGTGTGSTTLPTRRESPPSFADGFLAMGKGNICVQTGIDMYCWGAGFGNSSPALLPGGHLFARFQVSAHACGYEGGGLVWCWGANQDGQLGHGTVGGPEPIPALVAGNINGFNVTVGAAHGCAQGDPNGTAYCWGGNAEGQLGNGSLVSSSVPVAVQTSLRFLAIDAGGEFTCGWTAARATYCWGRNDELQLGNPQAGLRSTTPVLVGGDLAVTALYLGVAHACMTLGSGEAYCWGRNAHGELGAGASGPASGIPVKVKAIGHEVFEALAPGDSHTCALTTSGLVYCWGANAQGQLGNGTTTPSVGPVMVLPPP